MNHLSSRRLAGTKCEITSAQKSQRANHFRNTLQELRGVPRSFFDDYEDFCNRSQCFNQVRCSLERMLSALQYSFHTLLEDRLETIGDAFGNLDWNAQGKIQQDLQKIINIYRAKGPRLCAGDI